MYTYTPSCVPEIVVVVAYMNDKVKTWLLIYTLTLLFVVGPW